MEVYTDSVSSTPPPSRLRVSRTSPISQSSQRIGGGDEHGVQPLTSQFKNSPLYPDSQASEDEFKMDAFDTDSRLLSASLPPPDSSAPTSDTTHRLQALLQRFDNSLRTPMAASKTEFPPSPSEPDSDTNSHSTHAARASIRSLFQDALREPGDTPQKARIKRRASFNASDSPKVDKTQRKTTSNDNMNMARDQDDATGCISAVDGLRYPLTDTILTADDNPVISSRHSDGTDSTPKRQISTSRSFKMAINNHSVTRARSHKHLEPFESLKDDITDGDFSRALPAHPSNSSSSSHKASSAPQVGNSRSHESGRISPLTSSPDAVREKTSSSPWPMPASPDSSSSRTRHSLHVAKARYVESMFSHDEHPPRSNPNGGPKEKGGRARHGDEEQDWSRPASRHSHSKAAHDTLINHSSEPHSQHTKSFPSVGLSHFRTHINHHHDPNEPDAVSSILSNSSSEEKEELHERERNWNSSHPQWTHHPHTSHQHEPSRHRQSLRSLKGKELELEHTELSTLRLPSSSKADANTLHGFHQPHEAAHRSASPLLISSGQQSPKLASFRPSNTSSTDAGNVSSNSPPSSPKFGGMRRSGASGSKSENTDSLADHVRGHRRTITELSGLLGAYRKQVDVTSVFTSSERDSLLFGDESVPPPRMSTPPLKASDISDLTISPVPSDIPLPPSPPSPVDSKSNIVSQADRDSARLRRSIDGGFVFPSPQSDRASASLQDRIVSSDANVMHPASSKESLKAGQRTKSYSPGQEERQTPRTTRGGEGLMKTPRPPGSFHTPDHPVDKGKRSEPILEPLDTLGDAPDHAGNPSPGVTTLTQTPAPPGAYLATPGPVKLRGILKVRFDEERKKTRDPHADTAPRWTTETSLLSSPSSAEVPLDLSPSRRQKLRIVDEYGRTRKFTESGNEIILDRKNTSQQTNPVDETTLTPKRRAKMRQVDAFGNEVAINQTVTEGETKIKDEPIEKGSKPRHKKQALLHIANSLGEVQHELIQEENALSASLVTVGVADNGRLVNLATVSKKARVEREKLVQQLQHQRDAEGDLTNKLFVARNLRRLPLSEGSERSWWVRKWRLAIVIILLEIVLLYMGYRLAMLHAKHVWLSTYFDPFFPALYPHDPRPYLLSRSGHLPVDWTVFAISGNTSSHNVSSFIIYMGRSIWKGILSWRLDPWERSRAPAVPQMWPS